MKKLKTVVAGLGRIGWQFHVPSITAHEGFNLSAVCDPLPERRQEAWDQYKAAGYGDFMEMLEKECPDLVVIATPTHLHVEHAVAAMEHGCDVFLDKPIGRNLQEAEQIAQAQRRTGRKLMVYQPHRGERVVQSLAALMQQGILGPVYMIKMTRCSFVIRADWQAFMKFGGGMLSNYGAHYIDAALYLSGSKAKGIACHLHKIASAGDADDVVKIIMDTENHMTLDLDINMATALDLPPVMAFGKHGTACLVYREGKAYYHVRYFDPKEQPTPVASEALAAVGRAYVTAQPTAWQEAWILIEDTAPVDYYQRCYDYYALDEAPFVPLEETQEVMRVIEECRKSAGWAVE